MSGQTAGRCQFWKDRTAAIFAGCGMLLMSLALAFRINPVEGSVVPDFFFNNPIAIVLGWILFLTCMPVYILAMIIVGEGRFGWIPHWIPVWNILTISLQGLIWFLLGKAVTRLLRLAARTKQPSAS